MTNAEYYKNCSFDELLNKFTAACSDKSKQTIQNFNEWRKAEHRCLVKGDVIIRDGNGSKVEVVVEVDEVHNDIALCNLADYLSNEHPWHLKYSDCKLFLGKPICNINDLIKDPSNKYHFITMHSCPCPLVDSIESSKLSDLTHMPKANKSKKDKILDYMKNVMLIDSIDIAMLRLQSVKESCAQTFHICSYIFSTLYRVSPRKQTTLTNEFMDACRALAPQWLAIRKKCEGYDSLVHSELITMLDFGVVGFKRDAINKLYKINGEILDLSK